MYRKYYLVEVVLLLLLSHGGWNGPSVTLLSCTSETSKLVRDVVQKRFLSVVERYRVFLPLECPLHPRRDMFWWLQTELEATKVEGQETWKCPVCGKKFRCENTFVTHWDASHAKTLGMAEETVCLDDFCDVFRCDILRKKALKQRMVEEEEFSKGSKHLPTGLQSVALFKHRSQEADHDDDETRQEKRNCNSQEMSRIHNRCRSLIRQCTIGMLANMSSKDFQDIEDDLDQAICSFLTCDKYWDDFDSHIHRVPVLIIAILGLLVISLFCFCYYGLWILLEKNPMTNSLQVCCNCQKSSEIRYRKLHKRKYKQNIPGFQSHHNSPEFPSRQNSPESRSRHNSPEYISRQNSPEYISRQNSPEYIVRKNSPEYITRENSPEYITRQNSPEYSLRQNSPEYISRQNSPEYISRHNSPEYAARQNSPEYIIRQNSPEYIARQNSPEYIARQNSPEYIVRQNSPEYISGQNSPEYISRQNSPEYIARKNSPEYVERQNSPKYIPRKNSPEYIERQNSPEYVTRQNSPEYVTRQNSPEYYYKKIPSESHPSKHLPGYQDKQNSTEFPYKQKPSELKLKQNSTEINYIQNNSEFQPVRTVLSTCS